MNMHFVNRFIQWIALNVRQMATLLSGTRCKYVRAKISTVLSKLKHNKFTTYTLTIRSATQKGKQKKNEPHHSYRLLWICLTVAIFKAINKVKSSRNLDASNALISIEQTPPQIAQVLPQNFRIGNQSRVCTSDRLRIGYVLCVKVIECALNIMF